MNYPVWELASWGGGLLIAVIATIHVYVAHFAVGGGLFLVLTEARGLRENSQEILDFAKKHTKFFLLLTMVFGGLTGVAIWLVISVLAPGATSTLIHSFVWGWATEWVFFVGEIVALFIYHYTFGRMNPRDHQRVGWLYFAFAWLSLFIINGVVGMMLTPGQWLTSGDFWDGFFNPSFWPSLVFRTFLAFMIAGLFGFLTALRIPQEQTREKMVRACALWAAASLPGLLASGWWYLQALPAPQIDFILRRSTEIAPWYQAFPIIAAAVMAGALLMAIRLPGAARAALAVLLLVGGFGVLGSFEFIREAGRKPWLIHGHTWSTGVRLSEATAADQSFLAQAKWVAHKQVDQKNAMAAGKELFVQQCSSCHSLGGPMNDIAKHIRKLDSVALEAYITGQGRIFDHMPPFLGNQQERQALAVYLAVTVNNLPPKPPQEVVIKPLPLDIPPFDAKKDQYVLLAWNTLGMKCISDADGYFSVLTPGNAMNAVIYQRGESPSPLGSDQVDIFYEAPPGFKNPSAHVDFWKFAPSLMGKELPLNVSAAGRGMAGPMAFNAKSKVFEAIGIPVTPYDDDGSVNPYPLFTVTAKKKGSEEVLARTQAVVPVGSEMGCKNCHGGQWRKNGVTGLAAQTAEGILKVHDRRNGTDLTAKALAGQPALCSSCHPDPVSNAKGKPGHLNLPAAMHGFHANYLTGKGDESCALCHPDSPIGVTRCLRDNHAAMGMGCSKCHGYLEDHTLGLLKKELPENPRAARLMFHLKPRLAASVEAINPRTPWLQEPDCLNCHQGGQRPKAETSSAFNTWAKGVEHLYRSRKDDTGKVPCIACHNGPHAIYPTDNAYGKDRDNVQPLQYMGVAGAMGTGGRCGVCHITKPEEDGHHTSFLAIRK